MAMNRPRSRAEVKRLINACQQMSRHAARNMLGTKTTQQQPEQLNEAGPLKELNQAMGIVECPGRGCNKLQQLCPTL